MEALRLEEGCCGWVGPRISFTGPISEVHIGMEYKGKYDKSKFAVVAKNETSKSLR